MVETTQIHEVLINLADQLEVRPGLNGVYVRTAPIGSDHQLGETIEFVDWSESTENEALGRRSRDEETSVRGFVFIQQPGSDEETIRRVRKRAVDIVSEIAAQLVEDPEIKGTVQWSRLRSARGTQGPSMHQGRACRMEFTITYVARLEGVIING